MNRLSYVLTLAFLCSSQLHGGENRTQEYWLKKVVNSNHSNRKSGVNQFIGFVEGRFGFEPEHWWIETARFRARVRRQRPVVDKKWNVSWINGKAKLNHGEVDYILPAILCSKLRREFGESIFGDISLTNDEALLLIGSPLHPTFFLYCIDRESNQVIWSSTIRTVESRRLIHAGTKSKIAVRRVPERDAIIVLASVVDDVLIASFSPEGRVQETFYSGKTKLIVENASRGVSPGFRFQPKPTDENETNEAID